MIEHDTNRLVEEAGHIISSLDTQWQEEDLGIVAEKMLTDSVEILTISVVAWNMEMGALDELQEDGNHGTSPTKKETIRLSRADNMKKVREEQIKMANNRKTGATRDSPDMPELTNNQKEIKHLRQAKTMRGMKLLKAAEVDNRLVQDRSTKMNIIGVDVEALFRP